MTFWWIVFGVFVATHFLFTTGGYVVPIEGMTEPYKKLIGMAHLAMCSTLYVMLFFLVQLLGEGKGG